MFKCKCRLYDVQINVINIHVFQMCGINGHYWPMVSGLSSDPKN